MQGKWLTIVAVFLSVCALGIASSAFWVALQTHRIQPEIIGQVQQLLDDTPRQTDTAAVVRLEHTISQLERKLHTAEASISALQTTNPVPSKRAPAVPVSQVKEYFMYLGTGSSSSREWTDINSTQATIDTTQYGTIKSVNLEATLSIISGEVYARLKNVSTGAIYHASEVTHNTSTSQWRTSQTFHLPAGAHQYVVQLRSSNGEVAQLDGSRIKIVVQ